MKSQDLEEGKDGRVTETGPTNAQVGDHLISFMSSSPVASGALGACGQPSGPSRWADLQTLCVPDAWLLHSSLTGAHTMKVREGPQPLCSLSRKTPLSGPETAGLPSGVGPATWPPRASDPPSLTREADPSLCQPPPLRPVGKASAWHHRDPVSLPAHSPGSLSSSSTLPTPRR